MLWPQVVKAIAPTPDARRRRHRLAASRSPPPWPSAPRACGPGSLWLTVEEADLPPAQKQQLLDAGSRDTVRSRSFTGKPCRMLRNDWTEAWERPDTPEPLAMPLQYMVSGNCVAGGHRYADKAVDGAFNPVGQVVGQLEPVEKTAAVIQRLVEEYLEAVERLNVLQEA